MIWIALCVLGALLWQAFQRSTLERMMKGLDRPDPDDPRWQRPEEGAVGNRATGRRGPQLAGKSCAECNHKITMEGEARTCRACKEPVHREACWAVHKHKHRLSSGEPYR